MTRHGDVTLFASYGVAINDVAGVVKLRAREMYMYGGGIHGVKCDIIKISATAPACVGAGGACLRRAREK